MPKALRSTADTIVLGGNKIEYDSEGEEKTPEPVLSFR